MDLELLLLKQDHGSSLHSPSDLDVAAIRRQACASRLQNERDPERPAVDEIERKLAAFPPDVPSVFAARVVLSQLPDFRQHIGEVRHLWREWADECGVLVDGYVQNKLISESNSARSKALLEAASHPSMPGLPPAAQFFVMAMTHAIRAMLSPEGARDAAWSLYMADAAHANNGFTAVPLLQHVPNHN